MTDTLENSWSAFTADVAKVYLDGHGHPSLRSKELLVDILADIGRGDALRILDIGCGNGQLLRHFRSRALPCTYVGVDFSTTLLAAAREQFANDRSATFFHDNVETLGTVTERFDAAVFSHVIEILSCPEASLRRAAALARLVLIRFFEPPEFDVDTVELREMDIGNGTMVPYLRRKMSRDYYRLILARMNCRKVDIYQAEGDKDQIHVLSFN